MKNKDLHRGYWNNLSRETDMILCTDYKVLLPVFSRVKIGEEVGSGWGWRFSGESNRTYDSESTFIHRSNVSKRIGQTSIGNQ